MNKEIKQYFEQATADRKEKLLTLHQLILDLYPDITIDMQYKMPTYHQGDSSISIANQKTYVSLYTCGAHHIESFKVKHPKIKTGKGCINFRDKDNIPEKDVQNVIKHAIEHPKEV